MVQSTHGSQNQADAESVFVDPVQHRAQLLYTKEVRERQIFMQDLKTYRVRMEKEAMKSMRKLVGPGWYQVLSVNQRNALDKLEAAIYQDLLEGLPTRTSNIMRVIGIYPAPNPIDLMNCNYYGSSDPMKMLSELFFLHFGHPIEGKRNRYGLNAKLILSSILYLGLKNLIELLRERFKPDQDAEKTPPKPKPQRRPPLPSPYLEKNVVPMWCPASPKKFKPPPLPNLDELNEPYLEENEHRVQPRPPPPPPPPPPPKRVPTHLCDKLAGIIRIEPNAQVTALTINTTTTSQRKRRDSNLTTEVKKKTYGICITGPHAKKGPSRRKIRAPSTGLDNMQYVIQGVYKVGGRSVFVIGSVFVTPADGELIHGGFAQCNGGYANIHCGYRTHPAAPPPDTCDCLKKWQERVFDYVKRSKCYCGHHYDYGHEGTFPPDEPAYFLKPTAGSPYRFNYDTIFEIDEKQMFVKKEMKKVWETDSVIGTKQDLVVKKKEKKKSSKTCLGQAPKPQEYLKCALRLLRGTNVAARLPDVHLVPELLEWMRRRIYGPHTPAQRQDYLRKSKMLQTMLESVMLRGYGRVIPKKIPQFSGSSNWYHMFSLRKHFNKHTDQFKRQLFKSFANVNNLFWRIMFHAEFPDKKFREIFFSYLSGSAEDIMLMRPYDTMVVQERKERMLKRRYVCLPDGIENVNQ